MPPYVEHPTAGPLSAGWYLRIARACGLAAAVVGVGVLAGWLFDFRPLMTLLPGLVAMKPNTALAFCCGGLSLALFARSGDGPRDRRLLVSTILAGTMAAIGALTLAEYAVGVSFGIDEKLFKDFAVSSAPGRMAPISAFNFVCLGAALVLLRFPKWTNAAHALAGAAALTSLLSVVGLLYGVSALYQSGRFTAVALHSALAFLLLSGGICCASSRRGFMQVLTGPGQSAALLRRYGVAAVFMPFLIGWARVSVVRAGWCSPEMGVVLVAVANALTLAALGWFGALSLRRAEHGQAHTEAGLRESEERLHLVVEQLTEGLVIANLEGQLLHWNRAALEMHGFATLEEGLRRLPEFTQIFELSTPDGTVVPFEEWPMPRVCRGETLEQCEMRIRHLEQGWTRIFRYNGSMVCNVDGRSLMFVTTTDITRQKEAEAQVEDALEKFHEAHLELEVRVLQRTSELARTNAELQEQIVERSRAEHATRQVMDHSLDVICTFDAAGRFLMISRSCESLWGQRPEELVGRSYLDLVHPDDRGRTTAIAASIRRGKPAMEYENRCLHKNGSVIPVMWTAQWSKENRIMFCVGRDMTARKQVELAQSRAREAAEAANRAKSEFLANMSHEIRTPMNGVIGMVELVLDTDLDRAQREYLGMAKTSAVTLLGLINDILDFSKIEAGKLQLEAIDFELRDCLGATLGPLEIRAKQKGLALAADLAADLPRHVIGDPTRLRQVLINLMDNAIKFTARGGVTLRVAGDGAGCLRFGVTDTGIGIARDKQTLIFEAFAQADGTTTRTHGGTGLGLAIASRIVEQMGGRISVESTPGVGTAFHFTARLPDGVGKTSEVSRVDAAPEPSGVGGLRILLAEDNLINRSLATSLLEKRGHSLVHASNGREAVEAAGRERFDLIFMDVQMPEMDGMEATRRIRDAERASGRRTPIAAMTAHAMTGDRERFLACGMDEYISKPLQRDELFALLARYSEGRRQAAAAAPAGRTPPAKAQSVFSREELLAQLDGDEELMGQMIAIFCENTPRLLDDIGAAAERRDAAGVGRTTHALLSSLGVVGATAARQLTCEIASHGERGDYEAAGEVFGALSVEVEEIKMFLAGCEEGAV